MSITQALEKYILDNTPFSKAHSPEYEALEKYVYELFQEHQPDLIAKDAHHIMQTTMEDSEKFDLPRYIFWLKHRALQTSSAQALQELMQWFKKDILDAYNAMIVAGPLVNQTIDMDDGITVYPISQSPDQNLLSCVNHKGENICVFHRRMGANLIKIPVFLVWEDCKIPKIAHEDRQLDSYAQDYSSMTDITRLIALQNNMHFFILTRTQGLRDYEPLSGMSTSCFGKSGDAFFEDWTVISPFVLGNKSRHMFFL